MADSVRVLVVGRRGKRVEALVGDLVSCGHRVDSCGVREAVTGLEERYDVVTFAGSAKDEHRRAVMDHARALNPRAQRMDPLAWMPALLVAQCEWAGRRAEGATDTDPRVVVEAVPLPRVAIRRVGGAVGADVEVQRHRARPWGASRTELLALDTEGTDAVAYFPRRPASTRDFVSVRLNGAAVFVGDSLGRLPLCQ